MQALFKEAGTTKIAKYTTKIANYTTTIAKYTTTILKRRKNLNTRHCSKHKGFSIHIWQP